MDNISTRTMALMERFLDLAARRQNLIAQNLTQIDTPGYKAQDIPFEEHMRALVKGAEQTEGESSTAMRLMKQTPPAESVRGLRLRPDQNNVDIDREMTAMSANAAKFSVVTQLLVQKLRLLRTSINEGR